MQLIYTSLNSNTRSSDGKPYWSLGFTTLQSIGTIFAEQVKAGLTKSEDLDELKAAGFADLYPFVNDACDGDPILPGYMADGRALVTADNAYITRNWDRVTGTWARTKKGLPCFSVTRIPGNPRVTYDFVEYTTPTANNLPPPPAGWTPDTHQATAAPVQPSYEAEDEAIAY